MFERGKARVYLENGEHYLEMGETSVKMPIEFINHAIDSGKIEINKIIKGIRKYKKYKEDEFCKNLIKKEKEKKI